METPELKPCPFCGSESLEVVSCPKGRAQITYRIQCIKCGSRGPVTRTRVFAGSQWNARTEVKAEEKGATG